MRIMIILAAAAALAACSASADNDPALATPEALELKGWLRELKASDPDTARALVRECGIGGAFGSADAKLQMLRCMREKYDAGERA
jgi:hypothetical protein